MGHSQNNTDFFDRRSFLDRRSFPVHRSYGEGGSEGGGEGGCASATLRLKSFSTSFRHQKKPEKKFPVLQRFN